MTAAISLNATADALRRRRPDILAELAPRWQELGLTIGPERQLGATAAGPVDDLSELGTVIVREAREDLSDLVKVLASRAKRIAALRLVTGVASALASASLVGLLLAERPGQLAAAVVTLVATLGNLLVTFIEDFSGGAGSTAKLRDTMMGLVRQLAAAEGQLRLGDATGDRTAVVQAITQVNQVFGEIQAMRAQLGLSV